LPDKAAGASNTFVLQPGEAVQSVWYVGEHRLLQFKHSSGQVDKFEGAALAQLSRECPKHCILRINDSGVDVVETNLFGRPKE
jgi:hypothetical protein